jgi:hypothetical protein
MSEPQSVPPEQHRVHHEPEQLTLWAYCGLCGCPHYWLEDTRLRRVQHRRCGEAMDRWFRADNRADWVNEPNRAAL